MRNKHISKKRRIFRRIIIILGGILLIYIIIGLLPGIDVSRYSYCSAKLPDSFDGFKILQISDFHCKEFGKDEKKLLDKIDSLKPDIIVFTGDIIDGYHDSMDNAVTLVTELAKKYPIYQVAGNHEPDVTEFYDKLKKLYKEFGVVDLNDSNFEIKHDDGSIYLHGLGWYHSSVTSTSWFKNVMNKIPPTGGVDILLCHNASLFPDLVAYDYELILAGHLHGGVVRLPVVGGILNTDRTFGTEYEAGAYQQELSTQITSRGLGDVIVPVPRFYNKPELVLVTLRCE